MLTSQKLFWAALAIYAAIFILLVISLAYRNYGANETFLTLPAAEDLVADAYVVPRAVGRGGYKWSLEYITQELVRADIVGPTIVPICGDTGFMVLGIISKKAWLWTVRLSESGHVQDVVSSRLVSSLDGSFYDTINSTYTIALLASDGCSVLLAGAKTGFGSSGGGRGRALLLKINEDTLIPQVRAAVDFGTTNVMHSLASATVGSRVAVAWLDSTTPDEACGMSVVLSVTGDTTLQVSGSVDYGAACKGVSLPAMLAVGEHMDNVQYLFSKVDGGGAFLASFKVPSSSVDHVSDNFVGAVTLASVGYANFWGGRALVRGGGDAYVAVTRNAEGKQFYTTWRLAPNSGEVVISTPQLLGDGVAALGPPVLLHPTFSVPQTGEVAIDTSSPVALLVGSHQTRAVQLEILASLDVIPRTLNVRASGRLDAAAITASGMRVITISSSPGLGRTTMLPIDLTSVWQFAGRAGRQMSANALLRLPLSVPLEIMHETSPHQEPGQALLSLPREHFKTLGQVLCAQMQVDQQVYIRITNAV
jgi:hypothetical protein